MNQSSVLAACQWLLDELNAEASVANHAGAAALTAGDYRGARDSMSLGEGLSAVRADVAVIMERLTLLLAERPLPPADPAKPSTTPLSAYRAPILRALVSLGGSARASRVLETVHELVCDALLPGDLEPLVKHPQRLRWRTNARFCHSQMKKDGLLSATAPYGVWQITVAGRRWLEEQGKD